VFLGGQEATAAALRLMEEALRLFGRGPASADQAEAWFDYATLFLLNGQGRLAASLTALNRALEIAEAAGDKLLIPRILSVLAEHSFYRGQVGEGFAILRRGQALAEGAGYAEAAFWLDDSAFEALLSLGKFDEAAAAAMRSLQTAGRVGL